MSNDPPSREQNYLGTSTSLLFLRDYAREIEATDKLSQEDLRPVLMGLFGEIGGIMAAVKKSHREDSAYLEYQQRALEEEFGDALWYFTALCRRLGVGVDRVFSKAIKQSEYGEIIAANDHLDYPVSNVLSFNVLPPLDETLLRLGEEAAALLKITTANDQTPDLLGAFVKCYLQALRAARVNFSTMIKGNIKKVKGRFLDPNKSTLPTFDSAFPKEESLPQNFEIRITRRKSGQSYLQWNNVFIGEPLTDNIRDPDAYRFHDVFHFAHAAILHWSPVFRALIKQKRKSDPKIDEAQDGGRAIVVEEGLTAWLFSRAKQLRFFDGHNSVSFDLLKTVQQFVRGYEVEACPLGLWETAILEGYRVFREVRKNEGGIVVGNRKDRTIKYKATRPEQK